MYILESAYLCSHVACLSVVFSNVCSFLSESVFAPYLGFFTSSYRISSFLQSLSETVPGYFNLDFTPRMQIWPLR